MTELIARDNEIEDITALARITNLNNLKSKRAIFGYELCKGYMCAQGLSNLRALKLSENSIYGLKAPYDHENLDDLSIFNECNSDAYQLLTQEKCDELAKASPY